MEGAAPGRRTRRVPGGLDVSDPLTTPGEPGATRYMCPLCDWFYDESPLDYREVELPPGVGLVGLHDGLDELLLRRIGVVEVALREHFTEHTAAVILAGGGE